MRERRAVFTQIPSTLFQHAADDFHRAFRVRNRDGRAPSVFCVGSACAKFIQFRERLAEFISGDRTRCRERDFMVVRSSDPQIPRPHERHRGDPASIVRPHEPPAGTDRGDVRVAERLEGVHPQSRDFIILGRFSREPAEVE